MNERNPVVYSDTNMVVIECVEDAHEYEVKFQDDVNNISKMVDVVKFQNGPVPEMGVNGLTNEMLLTILIDRTEILNDKFPCIENGMAISYMKQSLEWFNKRTENRIKRQVEGKRVV